MPTPKRVKALNKTLRAIHRRGKRQDKSLGVPDTVAEIIYLNKLHPLLKRAWPDGSKRDVSWLTAELAALWEVSRVHIILVQNILKMGDRPNRRRLRLIAVKLDVNWFSDGPGFMKSMRRQASFTDSLYGDNRKQTKRRRTK